MIKINGALQGKLCSKSGIKHIKFRLPLRSEPQYYTPNLFGHTFYLSLYHSYYLTIQQELYPHLHGFWYINTYGIFQLRISRSSHKYGVFYL